MIVRIKTDLQPLSKKRKRAPLKTQQDWQPLKPKPYLCGELTIENYSNGYE